MSTTSWRSSRSPRLACCYRRVPFGHVEAGLRTGELDAPFSEEANRLLADRIAKLYFAPTQQAKDNLRREGVTEQVFVTGNTVVDALLWTRAQLGVEGDSASGGKRRVLVTTHRCENFGEGLAGILRALRRLAARGDLALLLPVHPNPEVRDAVRREPADVDVVQLTPPLDYPEMVRQLYRCE
ncbi:MAG: UDP-N-acetylglucosamine 2-epimerase [Planctomycetota bacterium]